MLFFDEYVLLVRYICVDKSRELKILCVVTDYVVNIRVNQLCGKDIPLGSHMPIEEVTLAEFVAVVRTVFVKVNCVRIIKHLGQFVH